MTIEEAIKKVQQINDKAEENVKKLIHNSEKENDFYYWLGIADSTNKCLEFLKGVK